MNRKYVIIFTVAILLIVAFITNPSIERHRESIRTKLNESLQKHLAKEQSIAKDKWESAGNAFGAMMGSALLDQIITNAVTSDNYLLFSTTKFNWEGKSKVVGVGAFGNVYLSKKIHEALRNDLWENR